jgi:UDP-3-O-[3-hydroxymyristoyl] glucosamine N-acyltransferase
MASPDPGPARRGIALPEPERIAALAERLGGEADRETRNLRVERVVNPAQASSSTDLVLLTSPRQLAAALEAPGVLLCASELAGRVGAGRRWMHARPMWVVAELLSSLPAPDAISGRHHAAHVEAGAELASDVELGAGAVVRAGARIGRGSRIGENAVIYERVEIGERVVVGAQAVIGRAGFGWTEGPHGLVRVPQLAGVVIEDDAEIGPLCSVDAGTLSPTWIGRGARLDAQVHVGHNARIGAGSLVAAQSGFAGSVDIGEGVLVGGQAGVTDHARIGAGARIAAKSGVIGDVPAGAVVAGFPAVSRARWIRAMARLLEKPPGRRR